MGSGRWNSGGREEGGNDSSWDEGCGTDHDGKERGGLIDDDEWEGEGGGG